MGETRKWILHSNHKLQHSQIFLFAASSQFVAEGTKADWIYKELSKIKCASEIFKKRDLFQRLDLKCGTPTSKIIIAVNITKTWERMECLKSIYFSYYFL